MNLPDAMLCVLPRPGLARFDPGLAMFGKALGKINRESAATLPRGASSAWKKGGPAGPPPCFRSMNRP